MKNSTGAPEQGSMPAPAGDAWFRTTHWTVVLSARAGDSDRAGPALESLCKTYWPPIYAYLRRVGHSPEDAQDLTQEFFSRLIEKDYLKAMRPEKGKFRGFLLMAVNRFRANEYDRAHRLKRGGGKEFISLDAQDTENRYLAEPVDALTPEKAFDRRWALTLLERVQSQLEAEFAAPDKAALFREIKPFLSGEQTQGACTEIGKKLGMTEGAVRVAVHRLRQRYRESLRQEIAHTVETPEEIDDEIRHLFATLS